MMIDLQQCKSNERLSLLSLSQTAVVLDSKLKTCLILDHCIEGTNPLDCKGFHVVASLTAAWLHWLNPSFTVGILATVIQVNPQCHHPSILVAVVWCSRGLCWFRVSQTYQNTSRLFFFFNTCTKSHHSYICYHSPTRWKHSRSIFVCCCCYLWCITSRVFKLLL